jgi:hypothetical protein
MYERRPGKGFLVVRRTCLEHVSTQLRPLSRFSHVISPAAAVATGSPEPLIHRQLVRRTQFSGCRHASASLRQWQNVDFDRGKVQFRGFPQSVAFPARLRAAFATTWFARDAEQV